MRTLSLLLLALGGTLVAPHSHASDTDPLAGWKQLGEIQSVAQTGAVVLGANAQILHSIADGVVGLRITSQPVFSIASEDWPVVEIGSVALLLARDSDVGRLILVAADNDPIVLDRAIQLAADGRSMESLSLQMLRQGDEVTVVCGDKVDRFTVTPDTVGTAEVVLSAGQTQAWAIERLEIEDQASLLPTSGGIGDVKTKTESPIVTFVPIRLKYLYDSSSEVSSASTAQSATTTDVVKEADTTAPSLEVFTPSAVRFGRADALREQVRTTN